jgi:hypothetical protein
MRLGQLVFIRRPRSTIRKTFRPSIKDATGWERETLFPPMAFEVAEDQQHATGACVPGASYVSLGLCRQLVPDRVPRSPSFGAAASTLVARSVIDQSVSLIPAAIAGGTTPLSGFRCRTREAIYLSAFGKV